MNLKKLACAIALATVAFGANATVFDAQDLTYSATAKSYGAKFDDFGTGLLGGGSDVFTFNVATVGTYHVVVDLSAFRGDIDWTKTNLNGVFGTLTSNRWSDFGNIVTNASSPFTLTVFGKMAAVDDGVSGSIDATLLPVPEPESYAMLLAGLGLMGTIARRRSKSKAV